MSIKQFIRRKVRNICGWNELMSELHIQQVQLQAQQAHFQTQQARLQTLSQAQQTLSQAQQTQFQAQQTQFQDQQARLQTLSQAQQAQFQNQQAQLQAQFKNQQHLIVENRKSQILNRWKTVDAMDRLLFPDGFVVTCRICGHSAKKNTYETKISQCIFNGGKLERFVCPQCGCIFGPLKMFALNPQELADEYREHYSVFNEGDSHESERWAFHHVDQGKEGKVYLNYGAGRWSKTSRQLREEGYTVYDYEPFAGDTACNYLITSRECLSKMRFDGIFSNDLIEHLPFPIEELSFMRTLLKDHNGLMAHATRCYDYAYAFTRFHYFFFLGQSMDVIAKKMGLRITITKVDDVHGVLKCAVFSENSL